MNNLAQSTIVAFKGDWRLPTDIAQRLGLPIVHVDLSYFSDGEPKIRCPELSLIKNRDLFIFPPTHITPSNAVIALVFLAGLVKKAGARRIMGVIPYIPFCRQDRSLTDDVQGSPLSLVLSWLKMAGFHAVISIWFHQPDMIALSLLSIINVSVASLVTDQLKQFHLIKPNTWLIAPDRGAVERVKEVARYTGLPYLVFEKQRNKEGMISSLKMVVPHNKEGTSAIIIDDIIATGGTALSVCRELKRHGFTDIYGWFAHPVFSADAPTRLARSNFKKIFITNAIPLPSSFSDTDLPLEIGDLTNLLVETIKKISEQKDITDRWIRL